MAKSFKIKEKLSTNTADIVLTINCEAATFYFYDEKEDIWLQVYESSFKNVDGVTDEVYLAPIPSSDLVDVLWDDLDPDVGAWEVVNISDRAFRFIHAHAPGKFNKIFEEQIPMLYNRFAKEYYEGVSSNALEN